MAHFVFSPQWFFGSDLLIDLISLVILLLIAYFSFRFFNMDWEKRKYLYLTLSFIVIATSFLVKLGTYFVIYYNQFLNLGQIAIVSHVLSSKIIGMRPSYFIFAVGLSLFRFLHLTGLYMLLVIYEEKITKHDAILILFSFFMITYFSHSSYFAFHLTAFLLLGMISFIYFRTFRQNRSYKTAILMSSFILIGLAQAIFIFETISPWIYVLADITQCVGYLLLLTTFVLVIKHGKKKKPNRHNI